MGQTLLVLTCCIAAGLLSGKAIAQQQLAECSVSGTPQAVTQQQTRIIKTVDYIQWQIRTGKLDDAEAMARKWIAPNPTSSGLQAALGEVLYQKSEMASALEAFNQALRLDPCKALAHYYAWRFFALTGQQQQLGDQQLSFAHQLSSGDAQIQSTWKAVQAARAFAAQPDAPTVNTINPPLLGFFAKTLDCDGIPIRSSRAVDSTAILLACMKIRTMLANIPAARKNLVSNHAELHIIGDREGTSDLPENRNYKHDTYVDAQGENTNMDQRTRGVGGLLASCGEENLLHLPYDRYANGSDTCTHEFAHDIMENGFTQKQRSEIEWQYHSSLGKGLWKGSYAAVNAKEYWAELSMWYFGAHGNFVPNGLSTAGPEALRAYDPGAFALVDRLYAGRK